MLKRYEKEIIQEGWQKVRKDVEVKLLNSPGGSEETFILCRSQGRKEKEMAIVNRFAGKLEINMGSNLRSVSISSKGSILWGAVTTETS